jgi:predicted dehydrogenase
MQTLKMGFIGAGFVAKTFHINALAQMRGIELAGVYSKKGSEELKALAEKNQVGECNIFQSIADLCKHCDVISIFAPNPVRIDVMEEITDAIKEGAAVKGVVCEKPLGRTVSEARRLVGLADGAGVQTFYFENQIYMKAINKALQQLSPQMKAMGPISLARSAEEHAGPHEPWFWDPMQQGGGVLSDMGCHSIAVGWYLLTPWGKPVDYLKPVSVNAGTLLLKWGRSKYRKELLQRTGVDYAKTPAEDFCNGSVTFKHPDSSELVSAQFTNSWMYDKLGLRLLMDGIGPGYTLEINTLKSPLEIFIGDAAAEAIVDAETALEKATASRGLLAVQPNETDLYGYLDEMIDVRDALQQEKKPLLDWNFGLEITKLVQAAYLSAEQGRVVDLTDEKTLKELESYRSLISQGKGADLLY